MKELLKQAKLAKAQVAALTTRQKNAALEAMAQGYVDLYKQLAPGGCL